MRRVVGAERYRSKCEICSRTFVHVLPETTICEDCYESMDDDEFDADELGLDPEEEYDA